MADLEVGDEYQSGPLKGLTPDVAKLGAVSFFADVASEMLYPIIPIFLTTILGAPVAVLGFIEGVAEATASLLKTVSGRLSDLSGKRRPYVFAGYLISAVAKPIIGFAQIWPVVLLARASDRFGKGTRGSARDALLADCVSQEHRGRAFGWHRAMDTAGAVVGPILALVLVRLSHEDLRLVFKLALIPGLVSALLVLTVRERLRKGAAKVPERLRLAELPAAFRSYLVGWGVFSIANSSDVFLVLRAQDLGHTISTVVWLYVFYNLVYAVASPGLGGLSDRIGRKKVLCRGLLVFAFVYVGFAMCRQAWLLWPLWGLYGLYTAATDGVGKAMAVDLVPLGVRASAVGLLGTVTGLSVLAASIIAGGLWQWLGPWATFAYGAVGAMAGMVLIWKVPTPARLPAA